MLGGEKRWCTTSTSTLRFTTTEQNVVVVNVLYLSVLLRRVVVIQ